MMVTMVRASACTVYCAAACAAPCTASCPATQVTTCSMHTAVAWHATAHRVVTYPQSKLNRHTGSSEYYEDWYNFYEALSSVSGSACATSAFQGCVQYQGSLEQQEFAPSLGMKVVPPPKQKLHSKLDGKTFEYVHNKAAKGPAKACTSLHTEVATAMPTRDRTWTSAGAVRAEYYKK